MKEFSDKDQKFFQALRRYQGLMVVGILLIMVSYILGQKFARDGDGIAKKFHKMVVGEDFAVTVEKIKNNCVNCSDCEKRISVINLERARDTSTLVLMGVLISASFWIGLLLLSLGITQRKFYKRISGYMEQNNANN